MAAPEQRPRAIADTSVEPAQGTAYPEPFAHVVTGRTKRRLGNRFGLRHFGVNRTELAPGAADALPHAHTVQDEFFYVLEGTPTLIIDGHESRLAPGDCIGFPGGTGIAHQIRNDTDKPVAILEVGDRQPGDRVAYPHDDLRATQGEDGTWRMTRKDGTPY